MKIFLVLILPLIAQGQYDDRTAEENFEKEVGEPPSEPTTKDYEDLRDRALYYFKTKEKLHHELSESRTETEKCTKKEEEEDFYTRSGVKKEENEETVPDRVQAPETEYQKEARLKREAAILKVRCEMDEKDCKKTYKEL